MKGEMRRVLVFAAVAAWGAGGAFAQKVKVGYDKSADFSKYRSYSMHEPVRTPSRPILYASVEGTIKKELDGKALTSMERDGDLIVIPNGGIGYGLSSEAGATADSSSKGQAPAVDVQLWAGFKPPPGSSGKPKAEGTLELDFVDRATNKVVWSGTVVQKLDPDKKEKSMDKIVKAIEKLLAEYPPKGK
jgi:Domain of unknown function (DUF4136)